jgi:hypothetical protein
MNVDKLSHKYHAIVGQLLLFIMSNNAMERRTSEVEVTLTPLPYIGRNVVRSGAFTALLIKYSISWGIILCNRLKLNRRFIGKLRFHLQIRRLSQTESYVCC